MRGRECQQYQIDNNPQQLILNIQVMENLRSIFPGIASHWIIYNYFTGRVMIGLFEDKNKAADARQQLISSQPTEFDKQLMKLDTAIKELKENSMYDPDWDKGTYRIHKH